jgi:hypothetical protein
MAENLLFMFPQKAFDAHFATISRVAAKELKKYRGLESKTLYELCKINERLESYRAAGFKVYHAVYAWPDGEVDEDAISDIITPKPGDVLLPVRTERLFTERRARKEFIRAVRASQPSVVGGFHYMDCVWKAQCAALEEGLSGFVDEGLTDKKLTLSNNDVLELVADRQNGF